MKESESEERWRGSGRRCGGQKWMRLREGRQAWGMGSFEEGGEGGSRSRGLFGEWSFALFGGLLWVSAFMYFTLSVLTMIMDFFALESFFHLLRIVVCIVLSSSIEQSKFNLKQTEEANRILRQIDNMHPSSPLILSLGVEHVDKCLPL